jgi:hypothetical protein
MPETTLRGYISGTPGNIKMAQVAYKRKSNENLRTYFLKKSDGLKYSSTYYQFAAKKTVFFLPFSLIQRFGKYGKLNICSLPLFSLSLR